MAENSVIISSEEEAKLLKPIDEYVEEIQKKIDALRADGFDKVNDLKKQIAIAKENKNLSATQRDKIIENSKKELENAKKVEADNKEEIKRQRTMRKVEQKMKKIIFEEIYPLKTILIKSIESIIKNKLYLYIFSPVLSFLLIKYPI